MATSATSFITPPTTPKRPTKTTTITTSPGPPTSPFHFDPFSATSKAPPGSHPAFSQEHYQSPSHLAKRDSPRQLGRSVSAPTTGGNELSNLFGSSVGEMRELEEGRSELVDWKEWAGAPRKEREMMKRKASIGFGALLPPFTEQVTGLGAPDDDNGWLPDPYPDPTTPPLSASSHSTIVQLPSPPPSPLKRLSFTEPAPRMISPTKEELSEATFNNAIAKAVELSSTEINLSQSHICEIPNSISEFGLIVNVNPRRNDLSYSALERSPRRSPGTSFGRVASSPGVLLSAPTSDGSAAFPTSPSQNRHDEAPASSKPPLRLILSGNYLTSLNLHLFLVTNLTILSLMNNKLNELPPTIGRLVNLIELNLGANKLEWLPSEILSLEKLESLRVVGNNWIKPPAPPPRVTAPSDGTAPTPTIPPTPLKRTLGPVKYHHLIPSLADTCIRTLATHRIALNSFDHFPNSAQPGGLKDTYLMYFQTPSLAPLRIGRCAWVECGGVVLETGEGKGRVGWAEERLEWGALWRFGSGVSEVPVRWRGCTGGHLGFLEQQASQ